jgi:hypothetical protein
MIFNAMPCQQQLRFDGGKCILEQPRALLSIEGKLHCTCCCVVCCTVVSDVTGPDDSPFGSYIDYQGRW